MRLVPFAAGIAGGFAIAAASYTGYWFIAASEIEDRIEAWADEQRARGVEVETADTRVVGFPLRFEVALAKPRIIDTKGGWAWAAEAFRARMRPWNFSEFTVVPERHNAMRVHNGVEWRDIEWRIDDGQFIVHLDRGRRVSDISAHLTGIEVEGLWSEPARIEELNLKGVAGDAGGESGEALNAAVAMRNVYVPDGLGEELGETVAFLDVDASLFGPVPNAESATSIAAWRDAGGTVELRSFRLRWGPLGVESTGTIALDQQMRPMADLTANIIGYGEVIDALIMSNLIPLGDAFMAKVAFNMLAEEPEDGGPRVLRAVPVKAQNGIILIGNVEMGTLPPIATLQ